MTEAWRRSLDKALEHDQVVERYIGPRQTVQTRVANKEKWKPWMLEIVIKYKKQGWKAKDIAPLLGVHPSTVSKRWREHVAKIKGVQNA